jgi:hypothetical protein
LIVDRKILEGPWVWVVGGILVSTWLLGVIHAWSAHSRISAVGALLLPPYGLYLAVEQMNAHPITGPASEASMAGGLPANAEGGYFEQCLEKRVVSDQLNFSDTQNEVFCSCSAEMLSAKIPAGEDAYIAEHGENSPAFMVLRQSVTESCFDSARSVGAPDADRER